MDNKDQIRDNLINNVFGKSTNTPVANTAQYNYTENNSDSVQDKHLKLKKEVIALFEKHGYLSSDQTIQAIIANLMSNLSRLKY